MAIISKEYLDDDFLNEAEDHFIYITKPFLEVLLKTTGGELWYIYVKNDDSIVGYLPVIIYKNQKYGNIANSLPFFGTNGSLVVKNSLTDSQKLDVKKELLTAFEKLCKDQTCVFSCVITSPFDSLAEEFNKWYKPDFIDYRIGQITPLKYYSNESEIKKNIAHGAIYSYKKGKKNCSLRTLNEDDLDSIMDVHSKHMNAINGSAKNRDFFENLLKLKESEFTGIFHENNLIGFIVFLRYRNIVNYYTVSYTEENYKFDGTAFAIYETMLDSLQKGYEYFDFGGTWETQENVYNFKKKYAAEDFKYYYLIKEISNNDIKGLTPEQLLVEYPFFYVLPFNELK